MHRSQDETEQLTARLDLAVKAASLAYALASLLWLMWILIPEHKRRLLAMQAVAAVQTTARRQACRTGHQAMGHEATSGCENYLLPYRLSLLAERAGKVYERLRYTA